MKSLQEFQAELRAEGVRGRRILPPALSYKVKQTVQEQETPSSSKPSIAVEVPEIPPPSVGISALEQEFFESLDVSVAKKHDPVFGDSKGTPTSGAKICELCSEDKAKIAKIIQRVVKLSEEKSTLASANEELEQQHKDALKAVGDLQGQVKALKRKFSDSLKMVKSYQDRLKQLEAHAKKGKDAQEEQAQFDTLKKEVERLHNLVIQHTAAGAGSIDAAPPQTKEGVVATNGDESHSFLSALALEISEATQEVAHLRKSLADQPDDVRTNLRLRSKQQALHELENLLFETKFGGSRGQGQRRDMNMDPNLVHLLQSRNASFMKETATTRLDSWTEQNIPTTTVGRRLDNASASRDPADSYHQSPEVDYSKLSARLQNKDLELTTKVDKEAETKEPNEDEETTSSSEDEILESFLNNQRKARLKKKPRKPAKASKRRTKNLKAASKLKSPKKKKSTPKKGRECAVMEGSSEEESLPNAQDLDR